MIDNNKNLDVTDEPIETLPLPGKPVRGSQSGRPLMAALDLLGRRWTLRILWELRRKPYKFRDLQTRCDNMSTSVLSARLKDMQAQQLVDSTTEAGWTFLNADLTINFFRAPVGDWLAIDAETWVGPDGRALARSKLADRQGLFSQATQSLLLQNR